MIKMEKINDFTSGKKLHLGCGNRKIHGFINVDIRQETCPDLIDDVFELTKFSNNSVDLIYASHLLEHVKRKDIIKVLQRWHDVLKPGGTLRISVPDFSKIVRHYIYHENIELLHGLLYARQANDHDFHYIAFDLKYMSKCLEQVGFKKEDIKQYNWFETEHHYVDDGSQAYLPHFDKMNGLMMSLNVEVKK